MGEVLAKTARSGCVFALAELIADTGSDPELRVGSGWSGPPTTAVPLELSRSSLTVFRRWRRITMNLGNSHLNFRSIVEAG